MKKYMRNKVLPMLMALVMVIGLLPVMGGTAKAATASTVYVGAVGLTNNTYTTTGKDGDGPFTGPPAESVESYAYFNSGTLTLRNFTYEGATYPHNKNYPALIYTAGDLTIKLEGTNTLTATEVCSTRSTNCGIYAEGGTATLTIQGNGLNDKLIVDLGGTTSAASNGIYVVANLSVKNCFVDITGGNGTGTDYPAYCCGIRVNGSLYSVRITDSIVNCTAGSSGWRSYGLYADQPQEIIISNSVVNATSAFAGFSASTCHKFELKNSTLNGTANGSTAATGISISTYTGSRLDLYSGTFKGSSQNYNPDGSKGGIVINGDVKGHNPSGAQWKTWGDASGTFKEIHSNGAYWEYTLGKTSAFICEPLYAVSQNATGDGSGTVALTVDGKALDGGKTTARNWVDVVITPAMGSGVKSVSVSGATINEVGENHYQFFMPASNVTVTVEYELLAPLFDPQNGKPLILGGGDIEAGYTAPEAPTHADGYRFAGWYTQPNGGGDPVTSGYTAGTTYYAHWTKNDKTVYTTGLDFTDVNAPASGSGFAWDPANNTLTLSGLYVDNLDNFGLKLPDGAKVFLEDDTENFIAGGDSAGNTYGIYSDGAYTLDGSGKLTVTAGNSTGGNSCGLSGTVTVKSGTVTAIGGNATGNNGGSYGAFELILEGGKIIATGGSAKSESFGAAGAVVNAGVAIFNGGNMESGTSYGVHHVTLNGGTVTATGGNVENGVSYGANDAETYAGTATFEGGSTETGSSYGLGSITLNGGVVDAIGGNVTSGESYGANEVTVGADGLLTAVAGEAATQKGIVVVNPGSANPGVYFSESGDERDLTNFSYGAGDSISAPNNLAKITFAPALDLSGAKSFEYTAGENTPTITVTPARWKVDAGKPITGIGETVYQLYKIETNGTETPVADKVGTVNYTDDVGTITDLNLSGLTPGNYVLKVTTADPTDDGKQLESSMKLTIMAKEFDAEDIDFTFDFGATVTAPVYNGKAIEPDVIIMDGAYQLVEGTDYDLIYGENKNAGTNAGSVKIQFKGNYDGEITKTFDISPAQVTVNASSIKIPDQTYTDTGVIFEGVVIVGMDSLGNEVTLVEGVDFVVNTTDSEIGEATATITFQNTPNMTITVENDSGDGNNQLTSSFMIRKDMDDSFIALENVSVEFNGSAIIPAVTVTDGETALVNGVDYKVTCSKIVNGEVISTTTIEDAGEYIITVTGIGNYADTVEKTFTVTAKQLTEDDVNVKLDGVAVDKFAPIYNGEAFEPVITITDGETPLVKGTDFTVTYSGNTNAGEATVTIAFIGNYAGENITKTFTIAPKAITVGPKSVLVEQGANMPKFELDFSNVLSADLSKLADLTIVPTFYVDADTSTEGTFVVTWSSAEQNKAAIEAVLGGNYTISVETGTMIVKRFVYKVTLTDGISEAIEYVDLRTESTYTLPRCTFTAPVGKEFKAWKIGGTEYPVGATITITASVTAEAVWKDIIYNVTYSDGAQNTTGITVMYGESVILPECTFEAPDGMQFKAWRVDDVEYAIGAMIPVDSDMTIYAVWEDAEVKDDDGEEDDGEEGNDPETPDEPEIPTYTVTITVKETAAEPADPNNPYVVCSDATVTIVSIDGSTQEAKRYGNGRYSFEEISSGTYNVVIEKNGKTKTILVIVDENNIDLGEVKLPSKNVNSTVEVKVDVAADSPIKGALVGGLDALADTIAGDIPDVPNATVIVDVAMKIDTKMSDAVNEVHKNDIEQVAQQQSENLTFLDIAISQTITTIRGEESDEDVNPINDTGSHLGIVIPFVTDGKEDFAVYRYHTESGNFEGTVQKLTTIPNDADEYIEIGDGTITMYVRYFSTYAIGYSIIKYDVSFDANGGSGAMASVTVEENGEYTLPACGFTAPLGKKFRTWEINGTEYAVGSKITVTDNVTITAVWQDIPAAPSEPDVPVVPNIPTNPSYLVSVSGSFEGGKVEVANGSATQGSTVTLAVTPDDGYELETLSVTDNKGNAIAVTKIGDGKYTFVMPAGQVSISATFVKKGTGCTKGTSCPIWPYTDAKTTAWYHDGVHYCIENGLMNGLTTTQFAPNGTTTRAQIVTILWRLEGQPVVNYAMSFTDVATGKWYTEAVRWAASENIVGGYNATSFGPNDSITREQMAAILWRYCQYKGIDVSVGEETNILSYPDAFDVSEWAIPAMQWACGAGVISGKTVGNIMKLDPTGSATRAQVATMLQRFCTEIMKP